MRAGFIDGEVTTKPLEDGVVAVMANGGQFAYFLTQDGVLKAVSESDGFVYTVCDVDGVSVCSRGEFMIHVDEMNDIVILASRRRLVAVTLDVPRIILSQGCTRQTSVSCEFDSPVDAVSVWGSPVAAEPDVGLMRSHTKQNEVFLVFAVSGASLYSMHLINEHEGDHNGWLGQESTLGTDVDDMRDHTSWITSLSDGCCGIGLSGDAVGSIKVWRVDNIERETSRSGDGGGQKECALWFGVVDFTQAPIFAISDNCILDDPTRTGFWVYDAQGVFTFCEVERVKPRLTKLRRLTWPTRLGRVQQILFESNSSLNTIRLRCSSRDAGIVMDHVLDETVHTQFCLTLDPRRGRGHRALVKCVALVRSTTLMVAAFNDKTIVIFDYQLGLRRSDPLVLPRNATALACHVLPPPQSNDPRDGGNGVGSDDDKIDEGMTSFKIIVGLENGILQEILVEVPITSFNNGDEESQAPNDNGSILDVLETDLVLKNSDPVPIAPPESGGPAGTRIIPDDAVMEEGQETSIELLLCSFRLINKAFFCPFAVTKVYYSTRGGFAAVLYGKSLLILYESSTNKQITHIDFDATIADMSLVESISKAEMDSGGESLVVAIRGELSVKELDLLRGKITRTYQLCESGEKLTGATIWHAPGPSDPEEGNSTHKSFILFSDETSTLYTSTSDRATPRIGLDGNWPIDENIDNLPCGMNAFQAGCAPIVCAFTYRFLTCAAVDLDFETYDMVLRKALDFQVHDKRVRVISAASLERTPKNRSTRVLAVLSDGTAVVIAL